MPLLALDAEVSLLSTEQVLQAAKRICDLAILADGRDAPSESNHYGVRSVFVEAALSELWAVETDALALR